MADNNNNQGTPLVPDDLQGEWSNDNIMLPSSAQKPAEEEESKDEKTTEDDKPVVDEPAEREEQVEYVEDPGEYVPQDYSFEVTTYDEEGNKPKSHKITSVDDWESLLESEPNFGSAAALMKAQRLATKMETNNERDLAAYQAKKADYDSVVSAESARTERIGEYQKEMDYLVQRGDLPKLTAEQRDADWSDPEVAKQDGIKEHIAVIKAAEKEMAARAKAGLNTQVSLIDAFNQLPKASTTPKEEAQARKAAGSRVASGAANPASGNTPKGIMVGRGGSLDDLGSNWFQ